MSRSVLSRLKHNLGNRFVSEQANESIEALLRQRHHHPAIVAALSRCQGEYAVTSALGQFLAAAVTTYRCHNVLEFGAGSSSVVLAAALSSLGGGKLTSIEQNPQWCQGNWQTVNEFPNVDADMIVDQPVITRSRLGFTYGFCQAKMPLSQRGAYDFVLIDSPQHFYGREGTLPLIYDNLAPNALIVLDDAARFRERWAIYLWRSSYPKLQVIFYDPDFGSKGLAVFKLGEGLAPRLSGMNAVFNSAYTLIRRVLLGDKPQITS
jgi:predicted O-methyltransferase YrrM